MATPAQPVISIPQPPPQAGGRQVGMIAPSHRRSWTHRQRLEKALSLLADDRLDVLLEAPVAFGSPARLPGILGAGSGVPCQRIDYP